MYAGKRLAILAITLALAACSAVQVREAAPASPASAAQLCALLNTARTDFARLEADPLDSAARSSYNAATERLVESLRRNSGQRVDPPVPACDIALRVEADSWPLKVVAASRLRYRGIANVHRRSGIGAAFVAVGPAPDATAGVANQPWIEPATRAITYWLRFEGTTAILESADPDQQAEANIGVARMPLAADFTAPYALWLGHAQLGRLGDRALFFPTARLPEPRIYFMQPYDSARRTIVLLHGLGSSPDVWHDLANDVLGDPELRARYQLWQVFYPSGLPIPESRRTIRKALVDTLDALDPQGTATSRELTLVGHSMGGVLARLLVVDSGDVLWRAYFDEVPGAQTRERLTPLFPYLDLEPLANVRRAVFIAAPHRGAPMAGSRLGRISSRLVHLPRSIGSTVTSLADSIAAAAPGREHELRTRRMDSIQGLRDSDRYLLLTAELPVAGGVSYHSIIGRRRHDAQLAASDDGVVPYTSAHLSGAASELVVQSDHDVPANAEAIREVLRILTLTPTAASR
jgi:pimeloyl-ACP methyl ester carboxylesterase